MWRIPPREPDLVLAHREKHLGGQGSRRQEVRSGRAGSSPSGASRLTPSPGCMRLADSRNRGPSPSARKTYAVVPRPSSSTSSHSQPNRSPSSSGRRSITAALFSRLGGQSRSLIWRSTVGEIVSRSTHALDSRRVWQRILARMRSPPAARWSGTVPLAATARARTGPSWLGPRSGPLYQRRRVEPHPRSARRRRPPSLTRARGRRDLGMVAAPSVASSCYARAQASRYAGPVDFVDPRSFAHTLAAEARQLAADPSDRACVQSGRTWTPCRQTGRTTPMP